MTMTETFRGVNGDTLQSRSMQTLLLCGISHSMHFSLAHRIFLLRVSVFVRYLQVYRYHVQVQSENSIKKKENAEDCVGN